MVTIERWTHVLSRHPLLQLVHALCQLLDEFVQVSLLLICVRLVKVLFIDAIFGTITIDIDRVVNGLSSDITPDIIPLLGKVTDLFGEVISAEGTLSFDLEPLLATLFVEVVLGVARKHHDLVLWSERDQADRTVWHILIFLLVLGMGQQLETVDVPFQ